MSAPISQQLEDLLNPLPKFVDPEDDQDEETKAKVVAKFDEGNEEEQLPAGLRKRTTALLADTDRRYVGKATSRKELRREIDGSGDDDDEEEGGEENRDLDEEEDDMGEEDEGGEEDEEESDEHDDIAASADDDNDEDEQISQMKTLVSKLKCADITLPAEMDFHKLTEGMDDLGESDENGMEESEQEDGEDEEEVEDDDDEDDSDEDEDDKEDGSVDDEDIRTFSSEKVDEEVAKGKAVKSQLALWDQLLEGRIRMQKALLIANQLPQPQTFPEFKSRGGAEYSRALKNSHKALKALQRSLLELQDLLLHQHPDTRALALGKSLASCSKDEEVPSEEEGEEEIEEEDDEEKPAKSAPPKRKLDMAEYPDFMAKRFAAFLPYRDATLQKWYDKTRLTMGKANKGFGAFERSILTQVEQVLMDKERLLRRTQTRRSEYRVLGKPEPDLTAPHPSDGSTEGEAAELAVKANTHLKDLDEEIFDDDDFYHQLLRELIERKTNAADPNDQVAMGRQWLAIQKLRSKIKRKVDTKASKGRKVRFHIHSKLMNFMAPVDHSSMNDEARSELYRSLFGREVIH